MSEPLLGVISLDFLVDDLCEGVANEAVSGAWYLHVIQSILVGVYVVSVDIWYILDILWLLGWSSKSFSFVITVNSIAVTVMGCVPSVIRLLHFILLYFSNYFYK